MKVDAKLCVLAVVFAVALVVADLVAPRLTTVGPFTFTSGTVVFPVTFIVTDLVHDLYGRREVLFVTALGLAGTLLAACFVFWAGAMPAAPFGLDPAAFELVFSSSRRVIVASSLAFVGSQCVDVVIFRLVPAHFLARATLSTLVSQGVDTVLFVAVAFGGAGLKVAAGVALSMYVAKAAAAVLAVPLLALNRATLAHA